jgi:ABC transporter substrate binding protein
VAARGACAAAKDAARWLFRHHAARGAALCCAREAHGRAGAIWRAAISRSSTSRLRASKGHELTYRELASRNVDILLAAGNEPALRAARAVAGAVPIVFIALDFDPVEKGYVTSLSRPGGNSTGIFVSQLELAGKRIELLREAFPQARRVGLLWDAASQEQAEAAVVVARKLGFDPRLLELIGEPPNHI